MNVSEQHVSPVCHSHLDKARKGGRFSEWGPELSVPRGSCLVSRWRYFLTQKGTVHRRGCHFAQQVLGHPQRRVLGYQRALQALLAVSVPGTGRLPSPGSWAGGGWAPKRPGRSSSLCPRRCPAPGSRPLSQATSFCQALGKVQRSRGPGAGQGGGAPSRGLGSTWAQQEVSPRQALAAGLG